MNEPYTSEQPITLHNIPELQEVNVREGIKLRPLNESDAEEILSILSADSSIRDKVTVASRIHTIQDLADEVRRYREDSGTIRYAIVSDNRTIGMVSLWRDSGFFGTQPNTDDYGFGYFIDPVELGKGLITSSLKSLMHTATKSLPVRQFIAFCDDGNIESTAVLTKLGFNPTQETFAEPDNGWEERKYIKPLEQ